MKLHLTWRETGSSETLEVSAEPPIRIGRDLNGTVVLAGEKISRRHAEIITDGDTFTLIDLGSTNGTFLNGERIDRAVLSDGDRIGIGEIDLAVRIEPEPSQSEPGEEAAYAATVVDAEDPVPLELKGTLVFQEGDSDLTPFLDDAVPEPAGQFPPAEFAEKRVPVRALAAAFDLEETTYLALGGGLGSFVWVDHLLIFGADPAQVMSIGLEPVPYARYARLCRNSQIPLRERLRSNSDSCPDNIWGWPGYAVREIWGSLKKFELAAAFRTAWSIFNEPVLGPVYTPRAGDVFSSLDREAGRIGWDRIFRYGRIKAIRKTDDGRYAVAYSQTSEETGQVNRIVLARFLHLAMGYPGVRFLPDLQAFREEKRDFERVINAYEEHEHVYDDLKTDGGVVLIRGRGIVASRIIQRLYELRATQSNIHILHLMRTPVSSGSRYGRSRRAVDNHWEFQPFNWPKACWGGELREVLERAGPEQRKDLYEAWGGTTTASRRDWIEITSTGLREGWYQIRFGDVDRVEGGEDGRLVTTIQARGSVSEETNLLADYILDCTGLEADLSASPVLQDLVTHHGLSRNIRGRLDVANDFEVRGMENERGRVYASGAMTLGGPYAPVDSFLGLQYAAQRSVYALCERRAPGLAALNPFSSFGQWLRWARGVAP